MFIGTISIYLQPSVIFPLFVTSFVTSGNQYIPYSRRALSSYALASGGPHAVPLLILFVAFTTPLWRHPSPAIPSFFIHGICLFSFVSYTHKSYCIPPILTFTFLISQYLSISINFCWYSTYVKRGSSVGRMPESQSR